MVKKRFKRGHRKYRAKAQFSRYLLVLVYPFFACLGFHFHGILTWIPILLAFGIFPLIELFISPDPRNLSGNSMEKVVRDNRYDQLLLAMVPIQYLCLSLFLVEVYWFEGAKWELYGMISSMGLLCGVIGINVAHELGHRREKSSQLAAKALLLTSLYMHFFIEHNKGHHKRVATKGDPSTSRKNEWLYFFWIRSVVMGYFSAWKIENKRMKRKGYSILKNEMFRFQLIQIALLVGVFLVFGLNVFIGFLIAAVMGFLLLETVNYIEHYGLVRKKISPNRYENTSPIHSWNSNHLLGRWALFELSRHSDHHYQPHKPYPLLNNIDESPQLPTGYPGMMILALFPILFFKVMNPRLLK